MRAGIKNNALQPGDLGTVTARPLRDGRPAGALVSVTKADGTVLAPRPLCQGLVATQSQLNPRQSTNRRISCPGSQDRGPTTTMRSAAFALTSASAWGRGGGSGGFHGGFHEGWGHWGFGYGPGWWYFHPYRCGRPL
jgi:hypothetical protein